MNTFDPTTPGKGFIVRPLSPIVPNNLPANDAFTERTSFTGILNNGNIEHNITYNSGGADDHNELVGKPYTSAINTTTLFSHNPRVNAFYFWTHEHAEIAGTWVDDYTIYNNTGTTSGNATAPDPLYIVSGQGFFVVGASGDDLINPLTLTFKNSHRVKNQNTNFLKVTTDDLDKVWLNLSNNNAGIHSQILIGFNPICTDNFNTKYDANYASLTISIDHLENLAQTDIYLKDNLLNITHDLKISDYNFIQSQTGDINTRFELLFNRNSLAVTDNQLSNTKLIITNINESQIKRYNTLGKLIMNINPNKSDFNISKSQINQEILLFFNTRLENGMVLKTKFINSK